MSTKNKLKYAILTIVLMGLCALTTAFPIKLEESFTVAVSLDLTYALLAFIAISFGGIVCGFAGVFGICLFNLIKNNSGWLSLLGLILGLTAGIIAKLVSWLIEKKNVDKQIILINSGVFFFALGLVFLGLRIFVGPYYITAENTFIYFFWPFYVLPLIIGTLLLVVSFTYKKLHERLQNMFTTVGFVGGAIYVTYSITAILCSLSSKYSFGEALAKAYGNYLVNFMISASIGILIAIALYVIFFTIVEARIVVKAKLREAE